MLSKDQQSLTQSHATLARALSASDCLSHFSECILEHVWDQLFTVDTIWNIGETGDIYK